MSNTPYNYDFIKNTVTEPPPLYKPISTNDTIVYCIKCEFQFIPTNDKLICNFCKKKKKCNCCRIS